MGVRDQILVRMYSVLSLLMAAALVVVLRVVWIQFSDAEELRRVGIRQSQSIKVLPARRGAILDSRGRALAINIPRYELALDPTAVGFQAARASFVEDLSRITGKSRQFLMDRISARPSERFVRLLSLSEEQWRQVETWDVPGVILEQQFRRRYVYENTAAHVLGHVDVDGIGKAGLELQYDAVLTGTPGRRMLLRDRRGVRRVDAAGTVLPPRDGDAIVLTIDLVHQTIMEEELARGVEETGAARGTAVAVDPNTGAILGMANWPTFDPNRPESYPREQWRNHAVTDRMEPGSTFKLVAAIAALEQGATTMDREVDTGEGWAVFHGRTMRDTKAHGTIPFTDVIALSSNVGMARTASLLRRGDLYRYARDLGFGGKSWIDLPGEVGGLLKKTSHWSGTTLTSMSIGYEVDVTALQLLMAYAALANGGLLRQPYVVAEQRDVFGNVLWRAAGDPARGDSVRRVFRQSTAAMLRPAFEKVVNAGTARPAQVDGLRIAGKTGTARKVQNGSYGGGYRATFVGFYPADAPQVAMVVVMDEPRTSIYGGAAAAPVFRRIAERWTRINPALAPQVNPRDSLMVPDVRNLPLAAARRILRLHGFQATTKGAEPAFVADQRPGPGLLHRRGGTVQLHQDEKRPIRAQVSGLGRRSELFYLTAAIENEHLVEPDSLARRAYVAAMRLSNHAGGGEE